MVTLLNDNVDVNIRGMINNITYQFFISLLRKGHDRGHETLPAALHYKTASTVSTTRSYILTSITQYCVPPILAVCYIKQDND